MHWSSSYIGLPWRVRGRTRAGVDCWGLCWLAWRDNGFDAPSYGGDYADDRETAEIAALIADKQGEWPWTPITRGDEQDFDLVIFRAEGIVSHAGLVVGNGRMLHIRESRDSVIEGYRDGRWKHRLSGIYRLAL